MSSPDAALREQTALDQRSAPGRPLLTLSGVTKSFGSLRAVDGANFSVASGSLTALIGPNGAGKTTSFNLIAGTERPDRGEILFDGRSIAGLAPDQIFRLGLARTFQVPRPFANMTVLENLMLAPRHQLGERFANNWFMPSRVRQQEQSLRERAAQVLETCALADKSSDLAGALSGGQQKLLELARVLMIDPRLILLDEPAAGVNPALLETLIDRVRFLNRQGITFLLIEHNMDMVMRLCDPVIVMAQGQVLVQGTPAQVREDPRVIDAYLGEVGPA